MLDAKEREILEYIKNKPACSSMDIFEGISMAGSYPTVKRILAKLKGEQLIAIQGQGKGTKYSISPAYQLLQPIDLVILSTRD